MTGTVVSGALAGFLATLVMTLFELPLKGARGVDSLPIGRRFARRPSRQLLIAYLVHFAYGVLIGAAFAVAVDSWVRIESLPFLPYYLLGLGLGLLLWAVRETLFPFWMSLIDPRPPQDEGPPVRTHHETVERSKRKATLSFFSAVFHLVYGGALALFLRILATERTVPQTGIWLPATGLGLLLVLIVYGLYRKASVAVKP